MRDDLSFHPSGYGRCGSLRFGVKVYYRHRRAWIDAHDMLPPPETPFILHHCDNPPCEEPSHLYAGTPQDNMDAKARRDRGRYPGVTNQRGERNPIAKLTAEDVAAMRRERIEQGTTYKALAAKYGVHTVTCFDAVRGKNWSHL